MLNMFLNSYFCHSTSSSLSTFKIEVVRFIKKSLRTGCQRNGHLNFCRRFLRCSPNVMNLRFCPIWMGVNLIA